MGGALGSLGALGNKLRSDEHIVIGLPVCLTSCLFSCDVLLQFEYSYIEKLNDVDLYEQNVSKKQRDNLRHNVGDRLNILPFNFSCLQPLLLPL